MKLRVPRISITKLREKFNYDPTTGELRFSASHKCFPNALAGSKDPSKPRVVGVNSGEQMKTSRVIWAIYYGEWPKTPIVAVDGDQNNFKISNLQEKISYEGEGITYKDVRNLLNYDETTGKVTYRLTVSGGRGKAGDEVDYLPHVRGYKRITINSRVYLLHRVIWLWWYGYWPENIIDHINRNPTDNRICNLREVSNQCNVRNSKVGKNNTTKVVGVCPAGKKYEAYLKLNYKKRGLGIHDCFTEAVSHRLAAEQCLDWAGCDSNSSAYQYIKNYIEG